MTSPWLSHERLRPHLGVLRITLIGYWIVLVVVMHAPKVPAPHIPFKRMDLVAHFVAYGLLAACVVLVGKARIPRLSVRWKLSWLVILATYAAADELLQPLSGRDCDVTDWIADAAAITLVLAAMRSDRHHRSAD